MAVGCASITSLLVCFWKVTGEAFSANTFGTASITSSWAYGAGLLISASEGIVVAFGAFTVGIAFKAIGWAGVAFAVLECELIIAFGAFILTSAFRAVSVAHLAGGGVGEEEAGHTSSALGGVSGASSAEVVIAFGASVVGKGEAGLTGGAWA